MGFKATICAFTHQMVMSLIVPNHVIVRNFNVFRILAGLISQLGVCGSYPRLFILCRDSADDIVSVLL